MTKLKTRSVKWYGYQPDLADFRDHKYNEVHQAQLSIPIKVDLSAKLGPVLDQGQLGSCTANSLAGHMAFTHPGFAASRLAIYYNERAIEGDIKTDGGAQIRDGIKSLNKTGSCDESLWPYVISKFKTKPNKKAIADESLHKISTYSRLANGTDYHNCLASGFPFVIGFTVYESFESDTVAKTGIVPMPAKGESVVGGHAVLCYGYNDTAKTYLVRNSWAEDWGLKGNFIIPQAYFDNPDLASDAWTIRA